MCCHSRLILRRLAGSGCVIFSCQILHPSAPSSSFSLVLSGCRRALRWGSREVPIMEGPGTLLEEKDGSRMLRRSRLSTRYGVCVCVSMFYQPISGAYCVCRACRDCLRKSPYRTLAACVTAVPLQIPSPPVFLNQKSPLNTKKGFCASHTAMKSQPPAAFSRRQGASCECASHSLINA